MRRVEAAVVVELLGLPVREGRWQQVAIFAQTKEAARAA